MTYFKESSPHGSVLGGALLIAGSCIGAGMLGLPIVSGIAGFMPSLVMFLIAALFMMATGLMLVEAAGWFDKPVNLLSLVEYSLGPIGKIISWFLYLFLFYALLVSYIALSGNHVGHVLNIPDSIGSLFFVILFGWMVYLGTRPVDLFNRLLMVGKIAAYIVLVAFAAEFVRPKLLMHFEPKYVFIALPVLVISFGFHNMVPSLVCYMNGDLRRVKQSILLGVGLVFGIYVIWQIVALGTIPVYGENGLLFHYLQAQGAAQAIQTIAHSPLVSTFAGLLAFFAILTSFLAQSLSLVHFLRDGFKIIRKKREHIGLCALALIPPLIFASIYPEIFYDALNFAGGICAVILFGLFPVVMIWRGRSRHRAGDYMVPGGKPLLALVFCIACLILIYQTAKMFGFMLFPYPITHIGQ